MKNPLFILFLITIGLVMNTSCKKEDEKEVEIVYPITLTITGIVQKSGARMFTNNTEITDSAAIKRFIGNSSYFKLHTGIFEEYNYMNFESADTALFTGTSVKFYYSGQNDLFLFYSKTTNVEIDPFNRVSVLIDTLMKYKYPKMRIPAGTNLWKYITKEVRVGHGNYQELELSILSYMVSTSAGSLASGRLFNEFYEGAVSAFGSGDTVAVQSFAYHLLCK